MQKTELKIGQLVLCKLLTGPRVGKILYANCIPRRYCMVVFAGSSHGTYVPKDLVIPYTGVAKVLF